MAHLSLQYMQLNLSAVPPELKKLQLRGTLLLLILFFIFYFFIFLNFIAS